MANKRNRAHQTLSLEERLAQFADSLRKQADKLPDDAEEAVELRRRIRDAKAALSINASLSGHSADSTKR
jgi:hypothetical protein